MMSLFAKIANIFQQCKFPTDLVTFTEEILIMENLIFVQRNGFQALLKMFGRDLNTPLYNQKFLEDQTPCQYFSQL